MAVFRKLIGGWCLALLLTGCSSVVAGDDQRVSIDTGVVGNYVPGTREWLSWPEAQNHCARFGKSPEIADLKGAVAIYRCVKDK